MLTNKTISKHDVLYEKGNALLKAAHEYWEEYNKSIGKSAVVWLQSDNGHFILFTRSEYKERIMREVDRINFNEEYMFKNPFGEEAYNDRQDS